MKRANDYDTPLINMIQAFNDHSGGECYLIELRDQWYFRQGSKDDNRFLYWLDLALELVNDQVIVVYKRQPGWYSEVMFQIPEAIDLSILDKR